MNRTIEENFKYNLQNMITTGIKTLANNKSHASLNVVKEERSPQRLHSKDKKVNQSDDSIDNIADENEPDMRRI
jgi:hypothetical protein